VSDQTIEEQASVAAVHLDLALVRGDEAAVVFEQHSPGDGLGERGRC
jgi:hypothetical protein